MDSGVDHRIQKITPLIRQYQSVKRGVGDAILMFRLGDFYEMFNEDAVAASKILGILLTKKSAGSGNSVPLAGVPVHSAEGYIARLVKAGRKVAICEQVGAESNGLMDRAVVRIVTAGTVVEENLLPPNADNFLGALAWDGDQVGLACVDISTGDFEIGQWPDGSDPFKNTFDLLALREVVIEQRNTGVPAFLQAMGIPISTRPVSGADRILERLGEKFGIGALEAAGMTRNLAALKAAGLVMDYLSETRSDNLPMRFPRFFSRDGVMELDAATIRNLEILTSVSQDSRASLWAVIDRAKTSMGSRLLRRWLLAPLRRAEEILRRQERVSALVDAPTFLEDLRLALSDIGDLERILSRLARVPTARVADLVTLRRSMEALPRVVDTLVRIPPLSEFAAEFPDVTPVRTILQTRLSDAPSAVLGEGKVLKAGVHVELDELRELLENQRLHLLKFQDTERARTGITSLKVNYNKIYGYYIEISKANLDSAPADYIRKQTLVNAERYITPELKHFEEKLLAASDRIASIEKELFSQLLTDVLAYSKPIREVSDRVADIDAIAALADAARRERFVRPQIVGEDVLEIKDGRHPVVERFCPEGFVPNDTILGVDRRVAVVTGPNMAGKSTFIRQTAVIVLLAQIGSFVPAKSMRWRPVDRIFTRIGASDDLSRGQSTFFVEMSETAAILRQATRDSLILLDEIGRGTSTYDGLSIAWAVLEHIAASLSAKTLFATHYHELADLAGRNAIHNLTVMVREWENRIVFLRKVVDGASDRSFGIAVADLAGIPRPVLDRARTLLTELESGDTRDERRPADPTQADLFSSAGSASPTPQVPMSPTSAQEYETLKRRLLDLPLDHTSPLDVVQTIAQIQKELKAGVGDAVTWGRRAADPA